MKKILPLLTLLTLFCVRLCFAQSTPATAENFAVNSTANSTIGGANQNHWYKIVTTSDGDITVSVTTATTNGNSYVVLYLYDADATTNLGSRGDYASNGANSVTVGGLAAGTYYVLVNAVDAFSNSYSISNSLAVPTNANDAEPNGTPAQAVAMNANSSKTGHIGYRGNGGVIDTDDYFRFTTTADGDITVSLTGDRNAGYVTIYLYDNDGTTYLGSTANYISNGPISFTSGGLNAGTYCIRVSWGGNAVYYTGYTISNSLATPTYSNNTEPNDYYNQAATNLAIGGSVQGHIGYRRNGSTVDLVDYYKLITNSDGDITVALNGDRPAGYVAIYLYDVDTTSTPLISAANYISNAPITFTAGGLAAGTYYVKVEWGGSLSYYTGYSLSASLTAPTANDTEPNDYFNQALTNLAPGGSVQGHIGYRRNGATYDTDDFYKLVTGSDGNITVSLNGDRPAGYVNIFLYDNDTTTALASAANYISNGTISYTANGLAAGTYYVRVVWGGSASYYTGYTLSASLAPANYVNDTEPNNTPATASLLNLNPNKSGHIGYRFNGSVWDGDDYWKIVMNNTDSMRVVLNFNSNNNPNAYVTVLFYNETQTQLYGVGNYIVNQSTHDIYFASLAAGNYYVRINYGGPSGYHCSYTIPVFHAPCNTTASEITAGGPTTFCQGGSVALNTTPTFTAYGQSNGYSSYLWSNAATTQNITVNSNGNYSVEAKDVDGCPHTSNVVSVTVNPIPATPTISTGGGVTTFCQGGSVTLTSTAASSYLWSTGATTQSIIVTATGNYSVTAYNAAGCASLASAITAVTVNPLPATPTIGAGSATTFCAGGSVTLTSSVATSYLWSTGATTQAITVNASGNYSVTVKNANNCSATSSATTVTVNPLPATPTISTGGGATTFCAGGSVTLTSSSVTNNLWSNGATTQSITVNASGSYTVTVTNANNCSATSAATVVTVNTLPTVTLSPFTAVCSTDAAFTLSGGSPTGGTYSGTGVSGGQFNPATAGVGTFPITYSYTNANNCTATATQSITVNNCGGCTPVITTGGGATTFCQGGSVTLTAPAGSTNYIWSTGETTQSIVVTISGNYSVTATNANNCTGTSAVTVVTVNPLPTTPTISTGGGATTFCAGGSVTLTSSAATSYLWSSGQTTQSINVNASGNYSVTVKNANNCSATSAVTVVTVNPLPATPTISAGGATTFCTGGSVTLTSSSATNNLWSNGATAQSITVSASGNYTVTITNANNCSAASVATVVTVNPLPTVTLGSFATVCSTDAAFALSGGSPAGGTYSGTGVSGGQFNPATAGVGTFTITYSYTNANNCTATATQSITVNTCTGTCSATISADKSTTFCAGGSVTLMASVGASYLWSNGATTQAIIVTAGGNYTVTVTNAAGCIATSGATTVTVNPLPAIPTISANGPTTFCQGSTVTLTSSSATNNVWSTGATTQSITVTGGGNYTVRVSNANNCSAISAATLVTVNPLPAIPTISAGGPTTFCQGESVTLTSSSAINNIWSTGATTQSINVTSGGNYTVTVSNANGCTKTSAATTVTVNNCGGVYCNANGNSKNKGYIRLVSLRTIFNLSGWSDGGYGNYLNQSTILSKRYDYVIGVTPGYSSFIGAAPLYTRVWMDFNQDGDFNDPGELVFAPSGPSYFLRAGFINIPNNALSGPTRMRVVMRAEAVPASCGSFAYGEVEDYTVVIGNSVFYKSGEPTDEPVTLNETFNLYPNPVSDELVIQKQSNDNSKAVSTITHMQIIDMKGRVMLSTDITKSMEVVNVRKLPSGAYIVRLRSEDKITTKKIVVAH